LIFSRKLIVCHQKSLKYQKKKKGEIRMRKLILVDTGEKCSFCQSRIMEKILPKSRSIGGDPIRGDWGDTSKGAACEKCHIKYDITTIKNSEGGE